MIYSFYFNLEPKAYADSTRFTKSGMAYKPKAVRQYQDDLVLRFHMDHPYKEGTFPLDCPLLAAWIFYLPRIKSNEKKNPLENLYHDVKPDADNLVKTPQDVIQTGAFSHAKTNRRLKRLGLISNDSRITMLLSEKLYVKHNQKPKIRLILCQLNKLKRELPLTALFLKALLSES